MLIYLLFVNHNKSFVAFSCCVHMQVLYILRPVVYAIMIHYQTSSISCDQKNSNETGSSSSSEHPTKNNLSWLKSYYGSNNNNNNNSTAPLTSSVSSTNYSLLSNSATASIEKALMATLALIVSFVSELAVYKIVVVLLIRCCCRCFTMW